MTELWKYGASELAEMIRAGKVSSVDVVEAHLARSRKISILQGYRPPMAYSGSLRRSHRQTLRWLNA